MNSYGDSFLVLISVMQICAAAAYAASGNIGLAVFWCGIIIANIGLLINNGALNALY